MRIGVYIPAVPVAQPRPRAVQGGNGKARMAGPHNNHPVHAFRATVAHAWREVHTGAPLEGPLTLRAVFVMPRPGRLVWKTRPMPREPYTSSRNDWDNLGKSVCDALNGVAWRDDGQIVRATVERWYAAGDESPHVELTVDEYGEGA